MKRFIRNVAAIFAAAGMIVACDDYEVQYVPVKPSEDDTPEEIVTVDKTFTASVETPSTKTVITDNEDGSKSTGWESGDEISIIWGKSDMERAAATAKSSGKSSEFIASVAEAEVYYAVYPSSLSAGLIDDEHISVTIPSVQEGSFANAGAMAAKATGTSFSFRNICALLTFTIERDDVAQVVFKSIDGSPLSGNTVISFSGTAISSENIDKPSDNVAFPSSSVGKAVSAGKYHIGVTPAKLSQGMIITAMSTEGKAIVTSIVEGPLTLERSYLYDFGVVDKAEPVTVTDYFVTPAGSGDRSGKKWENAFSIEDFLNLMSPGESNVMDRAMAVDGKNFHFSEGKYVVADPSLKYRKVDFDGYTVPVSVNIYGGYSSSCKGTDLSGRNPETYVTAFSGDKQYAGFVFGPQTAFSIDGVTFCDACTINDAELLTVSRGAVCVNSTTASVSFSNCIFKDNTDHTDQATGVHGGAAIYLKDGVVKTDRCLFTGNSSGSRGGVIRTEGDKGLMFLNNCVFKDNTIWKDAYGTTIFAKGNIGINKCLFIGNKDTAAGKNNPSLNLNNNYILVNSTIIEDSSFSSGTGTIRTETDASKGYCAYLMNNIVVNTHPADDSNKAWGVLASKTGAESKGYNIFCGKDGGISHTARLAPAETDLNIASLTEIGAAYTFDNATNKVSWEGLSHSFADDAAVQAVLNSAAPTAGLTDFGKQFADWLATITE